jgi:hypothetical protein
VLPALNAVLGISLTLIVPKWAVCTLYGTRLVIGTTCTILSSILLFHIFICSITFYLRQVGLLMTVRDMKFLLSKLI